LTISQQNEETQPGNKKSPAAYMVSSPQGCHRPVSDLPSGAGDSDLKCKHGTTYSQSIIKRISTIIWSLTGKGHILV